mgnify:CR=1 FL=1
MQLERDAVPQALLLAQNHVAKELRASQLGRAVDIARSVALLCSPLASRHTSGQVLTLAGCRAREEASPMEGMTAEEHARMMAGGTQGAVDTAGQVLRQPVRFTPMPLVLR